MVHKPGACLRPAHVLFSLFAATAAAAMLPLASSAVPLISYQHAPSFQAALVARDKQSGTITHRWRSDPQLLDIQAASLRDLIRWSFGLQPYQVKGPAWLGSDLFDVQATMKTPTREAQQKQLLRNVLAHCFNMRFHYGNAPRPVFLLEQAPGGAKLRPSQTAEPSSDGAWTHYTATGITMSYLARSLGDYVGRPVLDRTELKGKYDVTLSFSAPLAAPAGMGQATGAPSIYTALRQSLGLRLVAARAPILILTVDAAHSVVATCTEP